MIIKNVLEMHTPAFPIPLVFDSPHSGTDYPKDFNYICDFKDLEKAEDRYVDDLFESATTHDAFFLRALFPRTYIDVNRASDDIDLDLFDGDWPFDYYLEANPSNRSHAGIGLIRRLLAASKPVYDEGLLPEDIMYRIETYYKPYHDTLKDTLDHLHMNYGKVWHVNCHSMPSASLSRGAMGRVNPAKQVDFVLGDRDGTSCEISFTHTIRDFLKSKGYNVAINTPYKGVELVKKYSNPAINRHSIQIEVNRALYLNEDTYKKNKNYDKLKADLNGLASYLAAYTRENLLPMAAD